MKYAFEKNGVFSYGREGDDQIMGKVQIIPFIAVACFFMLLVTGSMAAPSKGVIYVDSHPDGAEIYLTNTSVDIDDNLTVKDSMGKTPREFIVEPGEYKLFLKKFGYITWFEPCNVTPKSYQVFDVNLSEYNPIYGAIHIDSNPPGTQLVLQRFIPNVSSVIYSNTPASLESLPPGNYSYKLTQDGYYPEEGNTTIKAGDVTEIYATLKPIPDSALITFKSYPESGARVILAGGNTSTMRPGLIEDIEKYLDSFEGNVEEASVQVKTMVGAETIPIVKLIAGLVGTTPFTMELHEGKYVYLFSLDGYEYRSGFFNVTPGHDDTVLETLDPYPEYVQVYFETNIDDKNAVDERGNFISGQKGAVISIDGRPSNNRTPCWVELPSNNIVTVTFEQFPMFKPTTITVDTTLFEGRPSKWGKVIQLEQMTYYLSAIADAHSSITPPGIIPVSAGSYQEFSLLGIGEGWTVKNLTVKRDGFDAINFTYNDYEAPYVHDKTLQNATITVSSALKKIAVNATAGKGGSVDRPGVIYYDYGTDSLPYNFTPDDDYVVKRLTDNGKSVPYAYPFYISGPIMKEDHNLICEFRPSKVWVFANATEGGSLNPSDPYQVDYYGCTKNTTAIPDPGYYLKSFYPTYEEFQSIPEASIESSSTDNWFCGLKGNWTWNAVFEKSSFNVSSSATEGGIIYPEWDDHPVMYGETVSFNATAFAGYQFHEFTDNGISKGDENPYNITVTEDHDIVAHFQSDVLTIEAVAGEGGIIEPEGIVNVTFGNSQCFNITANTNYYISSVVIDGEDTGNQTSPYQYCFNNVTKDHNISAYFTQYAYTITPTAGVGGTIDPSTPQVIPIGDSATFTITPNGCYTIKDVLVDGESQGAISTYTFEDVTEDHTIHADFQIKTYEILVNQSEGGVIDPAGDDGIVTVNCGSTQCFNITPDEGNVVYDVIVDNSSVGIYDQYCFTNITDNHTIEAVFVIPPEPDFESDRTRVPPKYPVTFKDFTRNNPTDWLWDFGDGEITTTREPVHYFAEVGNYTITLTAYNAAAIDGVNKTKEHYIEVTKNPIAGFSVDKVGGILQSDVQIKFTDTSLNTDGVAYGWVFGDGPKGAISKNATHNYTAPGVYQVTHQVELPFIAKDYAYETITILQKPEADFIAHPVSGKSPLTVQFEDRSQGFPTSWLWDFGDTVKSYDQNPVHIYSGSGNYTVSLSVFSDEGSSVKTKDGFITVQ